MRPTQRHPTPQGATRPNRTRNSTTEQVRELGDARENTRHESEKETRERTYNPNEFTRWEIWNGTQNRARNNSDKLQQRELQTKIHKPGPRGNDIEKVHCKKAKQQT